ncbi:MAG TPA: RNA-binding S4 domain-containing protein [Burkholderiales bacterium]|nr:RNA-binding S4 domain-containing protein [Burkholderiales bacterium]
MSGSEPVDARTRIDKWLWAARFFKTRSLAAQAVEAGRVTVNGERVKPAKGLRIGDELHIRTPVLAYTIHVVMLSEKRGSAAVAATLYSETDESKAQREREHSKRFEYGPTSLLRGRPTKRDRRRLERVRENEGE